MPRPYVFPDPNDRSPNNPSVIVSPTQVLGLYNQYNDEKMERVTKRVQEWFVSKAKDYGWEESKFSGNQCFLSHNLPKVDIPDED